MQQSRLTLIVDGNWLLMSRFPVLYGRYAETKDLMKEVKLLMVKSINIVLKTFPQIDNVIVVSDGGSWRSNLPIPDYLKSRQGEAVEYKGNRERNVEVDWDTVFGEFNNWCDTLSDNGITTVHEPWIEGDDWCWYWSNLLNSKGTDVIIWTKDRDITQLVNRNDNGTFTVIWNKDNGIFIPKEEDLTKYLLNPFYQVHEQTLREMIQVAGKFEFVIGKEVCIDKIIRGDAGDNIMPIITRKAKNGKSDKIFKVQEKYLPKTLDIFNDDSILKYVQELEAVPLYHGRINESTDEILDHFKYNRRLVVLDKSSYPQEVINTMSKYDDWYDSHKINIDLNKAESIMIADKNTISSILDEI